MSSLILQHPEWSDGDYDGLADGVVAGRLRAAASCANITTGPRTPSARWP